MSTASTSSSRQTRLTLGIDPGLATSGAALVGDSGNLLWSETTLLSAERKQLRLKTGMTKGDDLEQRLAKLWGIYDDMLHRVRRDWAHYGIISLVVMEALGRGQGGRPPDSRSVMAGGIIRAAVYNAQLPLVTLNPFELRRRLELPGRTKKDDMFAKVWHEPQSTAEPDTQHSRDAYCLAIAGQQMLATATGWQI